MKTCDEYIYIFCWQLVLLHVFLIFEYSYGLICMFIKININIYIYIYSQNILLCYYPSWWIKYEIHSKQIFMLLLILCKEISRGNFGFKFPIILGKNSRSTNVQIELFRKKNVVPVFYVFYWLDQESCYEEFTFYSLYKHFGFQFQASRRTCFIPIIYLQLE